MTSSKHIEININAKLLSLIEGLAKDIRQNIGSDPSFFYVKYYMNIKAHYESLWAIGQYLGFKPDDKILDLGSGLGTKCLLGKATWASDFTGLEPCLNSYSDLKEAVLEFKSINSSYPYTLVAKRGEESVFPPNHFDFIICEQVLEHVQNPYKVIQESFRILKPGGTFFFSTCNYRSFYEGHYRCLWFPFLNKKLAGYWLRLLGYNPKFLEEINFISHNKLMKYLNEAGYKDVRLNFKYTCKNKNDIKINYPQGFELNAPIKYRPAKLGVYIQHPFIQKILGLANLEYKIYGVAGKY